MSAAMWHDGSGNEGDKNVIIQSKFRGDEGYKLGRYHREAQIYLIDCEYDENMADAEIYQAGERKLSWGHRIYYFGSKKSGKQFKWLENNIELDRKDLNFNWVFEGNWQLKL
jgi:pectinesterase